MIRALAALALCCWPATAQPRTVAITVDDLPYVGGGPRAGADNRRLLHAFRKHRVSVTGFVIQKRVESLGAAGPRILGEWIRSGFDLGNHSYSHPDMNGLSIPEIEQEIPRGESAVGPLMTNAGKRLAFFRFPENHTGDTREKHDAVAAFLAARGYRVAACTIDSSDYLFNRAYVRMLAGRDSVAAARLRREYLAYTGTEIDYYAGLNRKVLGYEPPEVMLLHDNRLNADTVDPVLRLFETRGYRFVTLSDAQSDPAYRMPETWITKFGPMWGYRWARERHVAVDGRLETDPPKWILDYGKNPGK